MLIGTEAGASVLKRIRYKGNCMQSKPCKFIYSAGSAVVGLATNMKRTASLVAYSLVALHANIVLAILCKERDKP
jgi:hypothetical protein